MYIDIFKFHRARVICWFPADKDYTHYMCLTGITSRGGYSTDYCLTDIHIFKAFVEKKEGV